MRAVSIHTNTLSVLAAVLFAVLLAPVGASAKDDTTLYRFKGAPDGAAPLASLIEANGNLYGTTSEGGIGTNCAIGLGCGAIFRMTPGKERVLHSFQGGCDGAFPEGGLISDSAGNFYGTTASGGNCNNPGVGTVFKLTADGTESVLYTFKGTSDGAFPLGDLIRDNQGNLYGTAELGGGGDCGCGVVFEITSGGMQKTLYVFKGGNDGIQPSGGLVRDQQGNLYGVTGSGGGGSACQSGCGTVYEIRSDGTETVLYAFQDGSDGGGPGGDLTLDNAGNLYGATGAGGALNKGTIFRVTPDGTETVLYSFKGGTDGEFPSAGLVMDKQGNLYGATSAGGDTRCFGKSGCGTVFKLTPGGKETVLLTFDKKSGAQPYAGLLLGKNGMLYGTASAGGHHGNGVVFQVKK